jgi:uncharacterized membrane protein
MLEFSRPVWLFLLLALPAIVWLGLRFSFASLGPYQRLVSILIRCMIWSLLVCALAGVQFVRISDRVSVMLARDSSDSIDRPLMDQALTDIEAARKTMRKDDSLGKLNFGANALLEFLPQPGVDVKQLTTWQTKPRTNFTDIAEALQVSLAAFPANAQRRLVLLTDGNENNGSALTVARAARDNNVELIVVPVGTRTGPEVILSSLEAPPKAALGQTVSVRFVLDSTVATPAAVSLIRNGEFVDKVQLSVRPGKEVYEFPINIDQAGFFTYELAVEPKHDTIAENNRAYTFSVVQGQPRLLYATGDPNELRFLPETFRSHNIAVDVVSPGGIPYSLEDFQIYDGIIFSDVAAFDISDDQMKMIQVLVRDFGRGFMMIGGQKSFGPGGYFDTPIEETLPVNMDFRRKKITPSTLVVCIIDKSGSMGETVQGTMKIDMAKESLKQVVKLQSPHDYVGVMGFDGVGQWIVKPTQGVNKQETLETISAIQPGGGSVLGPALESAYEESKSIKTQIKHFIVFTDGMVAPDDFEGITKRMVADNCTVSTVAFGRDADVPFMIPAGDNPLTSAIGWSSAPLLYGYVATSAKDNAQTPLVTPKDDPLLATWRYGLGKSAAFTSDAKNRWARDWLGWGGYERFWTGVARWMRNDLDSGGLSVQTSMSGGQGVIQVSAASQGGQFVNGATMEARVTDPDLNVRSIKFDQSGPGQYSGKFPLGLNGNYFVNVVQSQSGPDGKTNEVTGAQAAGLALSYSPEYRDLKSNTFMLAQLQETSVLQGSVTLAGLFTDDRRPQKRLEDAWELFALIALYLWIVDVAARRLVINFADLRLIAAAALATPAARRALASREALGTLMKAKERAHVGEASSVAAAADVSAIQSRLNRRREQLAQQSEASQRASERSVVLPPDQPTAVITPSTPKPITPIDGISALRQRLIEKERDGQPGPPAQVRLDNIGKKQPEAVASGIESTGVSDVDFTKELLKRKERKDE